MIFIKPSFYDRFKCIASKCKDNCCIGWEIDVDDETLEKYNKLNTPFGDEIRSKITVSLDGSRCFALVENERCPFLNENNLCRIIINSGEDALCEICKNHPRFFEWFPGVTECGLGLSCEEVCRILLSTDEPFSLVSEDDGEGFIIQTDEQFEEYDFYDDIAYLRESIFGILNRSDISFNEKIAEIICEAENFCGKKIEILDFPEVLGIYRKTEPINDQWTTFINALTEVYPELSGKTEELSEKIDGDSLYSKILSYMIYRHLTKAVFDNSVSERILFAIESVRFIRLCDLYTYYIKDELTLNDRIENLKNWSKQIEYSEENTELLIYGE